MISTCPCNIWPEGPNTSDRPRKVCLDIYQQFRILQEYEVASKRYVGISGKHYIHVCWLKESRKAAARGQVHYLMSNAHHFVSKQVSAIRLWSSTTNNKWWCCLSCRYIQATIRAFTQGFSNSSTIFFLAHLPQATAFLIHFGQWRPRIAFFFYRLDHPTARFIYVALTTNLDYLHA